MIEKETRKPLERILRYTIVFLALVFLVGLNGVNTILSLFLSS